MAIVHDPKSGFCLDIRRDAIGYGQTPDEARRSADQAERAIARKAGDPMERARRKWQSPAACVHSLQTNEST